MSNKNNFYFFFLVFINRFVISIPSTPISQILCNYNRSLCILSVEKLLSTKRLFLTRNAIATVRTRFAENPRLFRACDCGWK